MNLRNLVIACGALFILTGCYTVPMPTGHFRQVNQALWETGENPRLPDNSERREMMVRLWADEPAYVARLRDERKLKKMPRLVSAAAPVYPLGPLFSELKSTVLVSIVINRSGAVEAARILESSDSRFDRSALRAVKRWKFRAAEDESGPTIAVFAVPVIFEIRSESDIN